MVSKARPRAQTASKANMTTTQMLGRRVWTVVPVSFLLQVQQHALTAAPATLMLTATLLPSVLSAPPGGTVRLV